MTEHQALGTVSFLINIGRHEEISAEELAEAEDVVVGMFSDGLRRHGVSDFVAVISSSSRQGCIVVTITIGNLLISTAVVAAPFAVIAFLRDYPDVRKGLILVIQDMNMIRIGLGRLGSKLMCVLRTDIPGLEDIKPPPDDIQ